MMKTPLKKQFSGRQGAAGIPEFTIAWILMINLCIIFVMCMLGTSLKVFLSK